MGHRILIPFELPDGNPISATLAEDLVDMDIVALAHFGLPEQTPPSAGQDQFGEEADRELSELVQPLVERGVDVKQRVVFGQARDRTINRVAVEEGCDVIFTPGEGEPSAIDEVFVPVRGEENFRGLLSFAAELALDTDASVFLFHDTEKTDRRPGEELLSDAAEELVQYGIDEDRIDRQLAHETNVHDVIVARAGEFDAVVLGESEPSLTERFFGRRPAEITLDTDRPTFVVGNPETHNAGD